MSWYAFSDAAVEACAVGLLAGVAAFGLLQAFTAGWDAWDRLRARNNNKKRGSES